MAVTGRHLVLVANHWDNAICFRTSFAPSNLDCRDSVELSADAYMHVQRTLCQLCRVRIVEWNKLL